MCSNNRTLIYSIAVISLVISNSCSLISAQRNTALDSNRVTRTAQKKGAPTDGIRSVDFRNLEYPAAPIYDEADPPFRLKDGKYDGRVFLGDTEPAPVHLSQKSYGDVTGDRVEEAMVVLLEAGRGTAILYCVYVFTLSEGAPRVLWSFATGDRADGGLRRVYASNGNLVVELYGKDTLVNGNLKDKDDLGACCPKSFTRTVYQWNARSFQQKGENGVIPEPNATGDLLPPTVQ